MKPIKTIILIIILSIFSSYSLAQKDIQLNLQNADIKAFIETVSKITGKNFVIDPSVSGSVTLLSPKTLDKESLYEVFLTVLDVHGFTAVNTGSNIIKIIPNNKTRQNHIGHNGITRVYKLTNSNATQILAAMKPILPAGTFISADSKSNLIILSGSADDVDRGIDVLSRIDKAESNDYDIIRLQNASATDVAKTVSLMLSNTASSGTIKVIADERTNSVLVNSPKAQRLKIKTLITHLDTPIERSGNTEVIYLKNASAADVAEVLSDAKTSIEQSSEKEQAKISSGTQEDNNVDIRADENTNALIITAPPATMRNLKQIIAKLDIRRSQVLVQAIIAEVNTDDINNLGVQWYGAGGDGTIPVGLINFAGTGAGSLLDLGAAYAQYQSDGTLSTGGIGSGATFGIGNENLGVLLNALSEKTDSNILSTPSILVMDNQEAEMIVGENIPYVTGSYTTSGDSSSNPFTTVERQDVGVKLTVTPQINEGDVVSLSVYQEVSDVLTTDAQLGPTTTKRALKTAVLVKDNQILVLGGLIDNQQKKTEQKVPLLGDIPLVGGLFRSTSGSDSKRNLMVFLRPTIIRDTNDANFATKEKYNYIRNRQLANPVVTKDSVLKPYQQDNIYQKNPAPVFERGTTYRK